MHLYFWLRGINAHVELCKIMLQAQFFKWRRIDLKTGQENFQLVQGALRPTIFGAYEYVFPEEALPEVLSMIGANEKDTNRLRLRLMKPLFNCKKIPHKIYEQAKTIPSTISFKEGYRGLGNCIFDSVAYHIIGIKKDKRQICKEWGYEQEML